MSFFLTYNLLDIHRNQYLVVIIHVFIFIDQVLSECCMMELKLYDTLI
jgi:hypothetical protein